MKKEHLKSFAGLSSLILGVAAVIVLSASAYIVGEAEQAVILQFGRPIGEAVDRAGLHFKMPFVQEVKRFDRRILSWDGDPNQIPTLGREFISIDTTARWRIVDPLRFFQSVRDETGAQSRLDDIIDSVVRDQISRTELNEIVRSADWNVTSEDLDRVDVVARDDEAEDLTEEVQLGRDKLIQRILEEAGRGLPDTIGIELVDVRIKRLNYIPSVREQVFSRMITERQRIAEQFRSEGQGEASRIQGDTARELAVIRSEAERAAEVIRGEADAEATRIYNEAYSDDPEFYVLLRTLESYRKTIGSSTELYLGADAEYFRFLRSSELE
jgi:membrane protease subunit HflC